MMKSQQVIGGVILVLIFGCNCVSALKCYNCNSNNIMCKNNFFVALGIEVVPDCICCRKYVTDSLTSRECATGLAAAAKCFPIENSNYVCASDYCNAGDHINQSFIAVIFGAIAVAATLMPPRL
jgi:hypothetical protein